MVSTSGWIKIWVFVILCSLLLWVVYMMPSNILHFLNVVSGQHDFYTDNPGMFIADEAGLAARLLGAVLGLASGFLLWGGKNGALRPHSKVERLIEAAIFLEGTYFVMLFPSGLWRITSGVNFLGVSYLLEAVLAGSVLLVLSFKVRGSMGNLHVLKWIGIAAVGYISALWVRIVFQWFDMIEVIGSSSLFRGVAAWGFLTSLTTMSLAIFFAVVGAWLLSRNEGESVRWFGLSIAMIGLHYLVYLWYTFTNGALDSAMPLDVWTLPFLGLGLMMLLRMKVGKNLL